MSNLVEHARRELELSGQYAESPAYAESIIRAVEAFASYGGHSGGSAMVAREQLRRLLNFEALSPLTSDPGEWQDRSEASGYPLWQNNRDSRAFSNDGGQTWWYVANGESTEETAIRLRKEVAAAEELMTSVGKQLIEKGIHARGALGDPEEAR